MQRILSIFLAMVFAISLAGFVSAKSSQTKVIAQTETPAPTPTPAPKKKKSHHHHPHTHTPAPSPSPMAPK